MSPLPHPTRIQLDAFVRGELDDGAAEPIEQHLFVDNCIDCRQALALAEQAYAQTSMASLLTVASEDVERREQPETTGFPVLDGLTIERELAPGVGAMSRVFLAHETTGLKRAKDGAEVRRRVAVKLLNFASLNSIQSAKDLEQRFALREQALAIQLQHRFILPVYSVRKSPAGHAYVVMRYVAGQTLDDTVAALASSGSLVQVRPLLMQIFVNICEAMKYAHERRVVHRDLKPLNILVGGSTQDLKDGKLDEHFITDWGVGTVLESRDSNAPSGSTELLDTDEELRSLDALVRVASRQYAPPEQQTDGLGVCDRSSDVFSLGGILAYLLTGKPVFDISGQEMAEVRRKYRQAQLGNTEYCSANLRAAGVDADLLAIVMKCLSPAPADRPADAGALLALIQDYLVESVRRRELELKRAAQRPWQRRSRVWATSLLGLLGLLLSLIPLNYWAWHRETIEYYTEVNIEEDGPVCIGKLNLAEVVHRDQSLRVHRHGWMGKIFRVTLVDARNQASPFWGQPTGFDGWTMTIDPPANLEIDYFPNGKTRRLTGIDFRGRVCSRVEWVPETSQVNCLRTISAPLSSRGHSESASTKSSKLPDSATLEIDGRRTRSAVSKIHYTLNEDKLIGEYHCLDSDGNSVPDETGYTSFLVEYTPTKQIQKATFRRNSETASTVNYEYDPKTMRPLRTTVRAPDGRVQCEPSCGVAITEHLYNADGFLEETLFLNEKKQLVDHKYLKFAKTKYRYDSNHRLEYVEFVTQAGEPARQADGFSGYRYVYRQAQYGKDVAQGIQEIHYVGYDESTYGFFAEVELLCEDGTCLSRRYVNRKNEVVAAKETKMAGLDRVVPTAPTWTEQYRFVDSSGQPCENFEGYSGVLQRFHDSQLECERYYKSAERIEPGLPGALESCFDEQGNTTEEYYLDSQGDLIGQNEAQGNLTAKATYRYQDGNEMECTFTDRHGNPVRHYEEGCTGYTQKFENGKRIYRTLHGYDEKKSGFSKLRIWYNKDDEPEFNERLDAQDYPCLDAELEICGSKFSKLGNIQITEYRNTKRQPVRSTEGFMRYDEINEDGVLKVLIQRGFHVETSGFPNLRKEFDSQGNCKRETCLDEQDRPMPHATRGICSIAYQFSPDLRADYFDIYGQPTHDLQSGELGWIERTVNGRRFRKEFGFDPVKYGYAQTLSVYYDNGLLWEKRNLNINGQVCPDLESGVCVTRHAYRADGQEISRQYLNKANEAVRHKTLGFQKSEFHYVDGKRVRQINHGYDPAVAGFASVRLDFAKDDLDRCIRRIEFGFDEKTRGFYALRTELDENGNASEEWYLDKQNRMAKHPELHCVGRRFQYEGEKLVQVQRLDEQGKVLQ